MMRNIRESDFSGEQDIQDAQEFVGGGDNGFFGFHPGFLFPLVVSPKHFGVKDCADGHLIEDAAEMAVASFGDFVLSFKFTGLLKDWVNSACGDDFLMCCQGCNIRDFGNEVSSGQFADSWNRGENIHRLWMLGMHFSHKLWGDGCQFFFQLEESSDAASQDFFSIIVVNANSIIGDFHNFGGLQVCFSSSARGDFSDDFADFFRSQFSGDTCGGNFKQEFQHSFGEDIVVSGQFVKDIEGDLFDSVFEFSNFPAEYFVFSAEEFSGLGSWVIDFIRVFKQKQGDSFCRDFVGGGFSQGLGFFEVFDEQWVKECDGITFGEKVIEDVDVVAAGGFNPQGEVLWVTEGLDPFCEFGKIFFVLGESFFADDLSFCVNGTEVQVVKGCVYADKVFKIRHKIASFLFEGIGNRMLSLPSSKVIRDLVPINLLGMEKAGDRLLVGLTVPGVMSSPCFQFLSSISTLIISKLYLNST